MATNSEFLLPSQVPEFARVIIECWKVLIAILITILLHQKDNNQDQPKEETRSEALENYKTVQLLVSLWTHQSLLHSCTICTEYCLPGKFT